MRLIINGEEKTLDEKTLDVLLESLDYNPEVVATALNGVFVPRAARPDTPLNDGDRVEIVSPIEGG